MQRTASLSNKISKLSDNLNLDTESNRIVFIKFYFFVELTLLYDYSIVQYCAVPYVCAYEHSSLKS